MLLDPRDVQQFYKVQRALMFFVNERVHALPEPMADPDEFTSLPPDASVKIRDAFLEHPELLLAFVEENPARLSKDELVIAYSWRHLVHGKFYVFRELKKYTVFLSADKKPALAYGVLALTQPFEELVGPYLPVLVQTLLLPFKDRIVYDGLINRYNISFGGGIKRMLKESFSAAKAQYGIVTSLRTEPQPRPPKAPRARPAPRPPTKDETNEVVQVIVLFIEEFCKEHLNDEYAVLCRKLAEKLGRKRPSPLLHGSPRLWASGIVRTIGWVNFLHDKAQEPHMRLMDIDACFGVSESAGAAKSAAIRKLMRIHQLDPNWSLPSRLDDNPLVWMLQVNGFPMDVRHAPREVQEIAYRKGLIPYIPADRRQGD